MNEVNELSKGMVEKSEIERKVRELIIQIHNLEMQPESLPDNISNLDSVQIVTLVIQLEETFGIMVDDSELVAENYETITKIVELISSKLEEEK